jgi:predicted transcriptional regulator
LARRNKVDNEQYHKAVIDELKRMSGYLALLASDKVAERRLVIEEKYLAKSDARKKMWQLMDGSRHIADIAKEVRKESKISDEAVRLFVNELEKNHFVEVRVEGGKRYPVRLI